MEERINKGWMSEERRNEGWMSEKKNELKMNDWKKEWTKDEGLEERINKGWMIRTMNE